MDYVELFDRQGQVYDDLLMEAARLPAEDFTAAGPDDGPSLRAILVELLDTQRFFVHRVLQGRQHAPLVADRIPSPLALGPVFGGFRLTLRDLVESFTREDLARAVEVPGADGAISTWTVDDVLRHLLAEDARLAGLARRTLRHIHDQAAGAG
jgi:uncharacterized damage-inducible protein DinB